MLAVSAYADIFSEQSFGDVNCDGQIDISDAVFLINYIFAGGPEPNCGKPLILIDGIAVDTLYVDTNWIAALIGDRIYERGGPVTRVFTIGEFGQPIHWMMIPDTVDWGDLGGL